jgi:hypothetical protein
MSAPTVSPTQASDYLAAVERELSDLPAEDRSALLEDLALHLDALAAEDDDRPLAVRLGSPDAYAADLRAAAGLPPRATAGRPGARSRVDAVLSSAAYRRALPALRATGRLLVELRPAWWVLRGYLIVLVPCLLGSDRLEDIPVPAPLHSHALGVLLVLAAAAGSVMLGRRRLPKVLRVIVVAVGVLLVMVATGAAFDVRDDIRNGLSADAWAPGPQVPDETYPLLSRYGPVTDVFPYAADGTPLEGVLLYDQDGRALKVGFQQWWADNCQRVLDQPQAADGVQVPNSYPQSYELVPGNVSIYGTPMAAGVCVADRPRPDVPLPTFPAGSVAPAPSD